MGGVFDTDVGSGEPDNDSFGNFSGRGDDNGLNFVVGEAGSGYSRGELRAMLDKSFDDITRVSRGDTASDVVVEVSRLDWAFSVDFRQDRAHYDSAEPYGRDTPSYQAVGGTERLGANFANTDQSRGSMQGEHNFEDPSWES